MKKLVIPPQIPIKEPASTSVGQCTNTYKRLMAIKAASISAGIPSFLFLVKIAVATAKLAFE